MIWEQLKIIEKIEWEKKPVQHLRTVEAQASLRIRAISLEPMLFAHASGMPREITANQPTIW